MNGHSNYDSTLLNVPDTGSYSENGGHIEKWRMIKFDKQNNATPEFYDPKNPRENTGIMILHHLLPQIFDVILRMSAILKNGCKMTYTNLCQRANK